MPDSIKHPIPDLVQSQKPENVKDLPEITKPLPGATKPDSKTGKISSSLFKKKNGGCGLKRPRDEAKEEDSIDADFFTQV